MQVAPWHSPAFIGLLLGAAGCVAVLVEARQEIVLHLKTVLDISLRVTGQIPTHHTGSSAASQMGAQIWVFSQI